MSAPRKPRVTVTAVRRLVQIHIRGQKRSSGNLPMVPDDRNVVREFLEWFRAEDVWEAVRGGASGGGQHLGYYTEEDAEKILQWCEEHGVELVDEHPGRES